MQRPIAHQIDEEAKACFNTQLPREWIRNLHEADYGIDYTVELAQTKDVSGLTFLVQLKGQQEATLRKGDYFSYSLKRQHAKYYVDRARQPVFLVLVDLATKTAYWLFLQQYLDDLERTKNWRSSSSVVVRVPTANQLSNRLKLEAAVRAAHEYLVPTLIRRREKTLQDLDPRFEVKVRQSSTQHEVLIRSIEPVTLKLVVPPNQAATRRKVERFVEEGLPTEFLPGEIRLEGSLLVDELLKKGVTLQQGHVVDGAISLSAVDMHGGRLSDPLILPATVTAGTRVATFEANLKGSPLQISTATVFHAPSGQANISFDITKWHGSDLRLLPHFDKINSFLESADRISELVLRLEVAGSELVHGIYSGGDFEYFKVLSRYMKLIQKARFLAARYPLDFEGFRRFTPNECDDIEELYGLLTLGEAKTAVSHWTGEAKFSKQNWEKYQRDREQDSKDANRLRVVFPTTFTCTMLGKTIELDGVESEYSVLEAVPLRKLKAGFVRAKIRTTTYSHNILRLKTAEPVGVLGTCTRHE